MNNPSFYLTVIYLKNALKEKPEPWKQHWFMENIKKTGKRFLDNVARIKTIEFVSFIFNYFNNFLGWELPPSNEAPLWKGLRSFRHADWLSQYLFLPVSNPSPLSRKQIIKVFSMRDINFDKKSLKGNSIVTSKINKRFSDYLAIFASLAELNSKADHLSKVKYLQELGIKSPVNENEFDFSLIKTVEKTQWKQRKHMRRSLRKNL